jgi:phosphoglycerol transferase MdoB-like AlkP superfamily enzyme
MAYILNILKCGKKELNIINNRQLSFFEFIARLKQTVLVSFLFLFFMTIFRFVFFIRYAKFEGALKNIYYSDIFNAFFLGLRLDLTFIGYVHAIPLIYLIVLLILSNNNLFKFFTSFAKIYFTISYLLISLLLAGDQLFYSYFGEHINMFVFGVFDDDIKALWITFLEEHNYLLIFFLCGIYIYILIFMIRYIFRKTEVRKANEVSVIKQILFVILLLVLNFMSIRGTFGMYPLGKMIPDVSSNQFINQLPLNGVRAYILAYKMRIKDNKGKYDLIKDMGYDNNIEKAFEVHLNKMDINRSNLLSNITYKTNKNILLENSPCHVILIVVESFGLPITKFQSDSFDILTSFKKHMEEDILFDNFVSSSNGTIGNLESIILGIPGRPNSNNFTNSQYIRTSFDFAPAFTYKKNNYETSFIYGGDLSWRDLGKFASCQGFDNVYGRAALIQDESIDKGQVMHPWGVFDEYVYKFIYSKLQNATKPQFIIAMTTNNHSPHNPPKNYRGKSLILSKTLKEHINQEIDPNKMKDYQYAVDMLGQFIDKVKSGNLKSNTIIASTADDNTLGNIMKYDDNEMLQKDNIPFYLYIPNDIRPTNINTSVFGSHKDIMPTLYNLSLSDCEYITVGTNLLDENQVHYGFNDHKIIFGKEAVITLTENKNDIYNKMINYYKATLAVTEYLVKSRKDE